MGRSVLRPSFPGLCAFCERQNSIGCDRRWKRHRRLSRDAARAASEREIKRLGKEIGKPAIKPVAQLPLAALSPLVMAEQALPEAVGRTMLDGAYENDSPGPEYEYEQEIEEIE